MIVNPAPYASHPSRSRGRRHAESEDPERTPFQRDRDRVIHSAAFRKLEYKTQVFITYEGDYFRTRLTHSLEVAQIARSIARSLGLCEDLTEALALAHDLGHTPFGHAGEVELNALMADYGGFDHNDQTIRVLTRLERRYAAFDGLNLTWESLEGIVKHNGPWTDDRGRLCPLPPTIAELEAEQPLALDGWPSAEAQVAALSDDIAYNNHDLDDGLRAGLFSAADLKDLPLVGEVFAELRERWPALEAGRLRYEAIRRLIGLWIGDVLAESRRRLQVAAPDSADAVRDLGQPVIAFSAAMADHDKSLKSFLHHRMYRHYKVNQMTSKVRRVVRDLFRLFITEPNCLPPPWQEMSDGPETPVTARLVADYIAGMTDRYALDAHRRLFNIYTRT